MSTITQEALPAGTWKADPVHSNASFAVRHTVGTFRAGFDAYDATVEDGRFVGAARADSVVVKDANLAAHLKSPEFFDAERHPEITFASTAVRREGDQLSVDGELTLRGVTRPVQAHGTITGPSDDPWGGRRLGISLEAVVDRTEFGLDVQMPGPGGGLSNEVRLAVDLELVAEA